MRKKGVSQLQKNICIMQMEGSQSTPTGFEPHHARIWSRPSPSCLKDKQNYHFMSKMAFSLCRKQASSGVDSQVTTRLPSLSLLRLDICYKIRRKNDVSTLNLKTPTTWLLPSIHITQSRKHAVIRSNKVNPTIIFIIIYF